MLRSNQRSHYSRALRLAWPERTHKNLQAHPGASHAAEKTGYRPVQHLFISFQPKKKIFPRYTHRIRRGHALVKSMTLMPPQSHGCDDQEKSLNPRDYECIARDLLARFRLRSSSARVLRARTHRRGKKAARV